MVCTRVVGLPYIQTVSAFGIDELNSVEHLCLGLADFSEPYTLSVGCIAPHPFHPPAASRQRVRLAPVEALLARHILVVRRRREHVQSVSPQVLRLNQLPPPPDAARLVHILLLGLARGSGPLVRDGLGRGIDLRAMEGRAG